MNDLVERWVLAGGGETLDEYEDRVTSGPSSLPSWWVQRALTPPTLLGSLTGVVKAIGRIGKKVACLWPY